MSRHRPVPLRLRPEEVDHFRRPPTPYPWPDPPPRFRPEPKRYLLRHMGTREPVYTSERTIRKRSRRPVRHIEVDFADPRGSRARPVYPRAHRLPNEEEEIQRKIAEQNARIAMRPQQVQNGTSADVQKGEKRVRFALSNDYQDGLLGAFERLSINDSGQRGGEARCASCGQRLPY
jgi:hypothetical protein